MFENFFSTKGRLKRKFFFIRFLILYFLYFLLSFSLDFGLSIGMYIFLYIAICVLFLIQVKKRLYDLEISRFKINFYLKLQSVACLLPICLSFRIFHIFEQITLNNRELDIYLELFLALTPLVISLSFFICLPIIFVLLIFSGTEGSNQYGDEPKNTESYAENEKIFSIRGRINRKQYLIRSFVFFVVSIICGINFVLFKELSLEVKIILSLILLLNLFIFIIQNIKRFHDINQSGFYVFLMLIPLINLVFFIILATANWDSDTNTYGPRAKG